MGRLEIYRVEPRKTSVLIYIPAYATETLARCMVGMMRQ